MCQIYTKSSAIRQISILLLFITVVFSLQSPGHAADPVLIEDITPSPTPQSSSPREITELNGLIYFIAEWDPDDGTPFDSRDSRGLWVKDLTNGEARLIRKIDATGLVKFSDAIFFMASKGIWKTDGTKSGTLLVKSFPEASFIQGLTNVKSNLYFVTETHGVPVKLWKSDGTEAGTILIRAFDPGGNQSRPHSFVSIDDRVFFIAPGDLFFGVNHNEALWKTDGTEAGTILVKDFSIENLISVDETLYFTARDDTHGEELWKSDGSEIGTVMVKDIKPGSSGSRPESLTNLNGVLYFLAFDELHGQELWRSDGTEAGTNLVKDILKGNSSSNIFLLSAVDEVLYFSASDGLSGSELWRSDGTETGTYQVKDIVAGDGSSDPNDFQGINGVLFFTAADVNAHRSLWKSDGTESGTVPVNLHSPYQDVTGLINSNGAMVFSAVDGVHGRELWMSDEAFARAEMTNIASDVTHSNPEMMININDLLYFVADDGLWANFVGSSEAYLVKDIRPEDVVSFNGLLYFKSKGGLWKSDGTTAGTVLVKAVTPVDDSDPWWLTTVNGMIYFSASNNNFFKELWKSDGTEAGTLKVKNIAPGPWWKRQSEYRGSFTNLNGTLYFSANDGASGEELWKSDGTESGTLLVKDIRAGSGDSDPLYFIEMNGVLYFSASDGSYGRQLWKSDGTESGTVPLTFGVSPDGSLVRVNDTLYFQATNDQYGKELWKSNGTATGTVLVKDIYPGVSGSEPGQLSVLNGMLFFTADDGEHGAELWKSDGTSTGTSIVNDIFPGINSSKLHDLVAGDDELFFVANDDVHGFELWQSNGTQAGTELVSDLVSGNISSNPVNLTAVGNTVFFSANDGVAGRELWKYDAVATIPSEARLGLQVTINGQSSIKFGPTVSVGSTLSWEYIIINDGDIPLNNVEVRERRKLPTLGSWTTLCGINRIPVGETASCFVTKTATEGMYKSLVSVRANTSLETLAKAFYFGIDEEAELEMTVTANSQPVAKPGPVLSAGEAVNWVYTLSNTGSTTLKNVEVRGRQKLPDLGSWETLCTINLIPAGESASCSSTSTAIDGTYKSLIVARNISVEILTDAFYQGQAAIP